LTFLHVFHGIMWCALRRWHTAGNQLKGWMSEALVSNN